MPKLLHHVPAFIASALRPTAAATSSSQPQVCPRLLVSTVPNAFDFCLPTTLSAATTKTRTRLPMTGLALIPHGGAPPKVSSTSSSCGVHLLWASVAPFPAFRHPPGRAAPHPLRVLFLQLHRRFQDVLVFFTLVILPRKQLFELLLIFIHCCLSFWKLSPLAA